MKYEKSTASSTGSKIKIEDDRYMQINEPKLKKVEISLADCLACSGCITSAESVLVTSQSQEELLRLLHCCHINCKINFTNRIRIVEFSMKTKVINSMATRNSSSYLFLSNPSYHWLFCMDYHLSWR